MLYGGNDFAIEAGIVPSNEISMLLFQFSFRDLSEFGLHSLNFLKNQSVFSLPNLRLRSRFRFIGWFSTFGTFSTDVLWNANCSHQRSRRLPPSPYRPLVDTYGNIHANRNRVVEFNDMNYKVFMQINTLGREFNFFYLFDILHNKTKLSRD